MADVKLLDFWAAWCIDPQTPVLTEDGYIKASQVKIGQRLVTIDPITKKQSIKRVKNVRIFKNAPAKKIILETGRELIGDTNHLVLTPEGFKPLDWLTELDKVLVYIKNHPAKSIGLYSKMILQSARQPSLYQSVTIINNQAAQFNLLSAPTLGLTYSMLQQDYLRWERVARIIDVENRDVIGLTVDNPHTIVTNGIVSHNCGPCKVMAPVLEEIKKELAGKAEIEEINVDEKPDEAQKYGVMSIPTYIVLKDGKEVGRKIGVTSKADLLKLLQS